MSNNRSDYNKPRFNVNSFLPQHLRNELSTSLFENLHNRFLSKDESTYQRGSVGRPVAGIDDRLPEDSIFRRAYQLQPHVVNNVDSKTEIANWEDIINRAAVLGIDTQQIADWGSTERFNFAPPINPDKLINYRDYYWVSDTKPEYITIQNVATAYRANLRWLQKQLDQVLVSSPIDQAEVDRLEFEILINQTKLNVATNESAGWDTGYFDDNGGIHASVDQPTSVVDFYVPLTTGVNFQINGEFIEPVSVAGTVATFDRVITPTDDLVVNLPWFYHVNPGAAPISGQFGWFNTVDGLLYRLDTTAQQWVVVDPQPTNDVGFDQYINKSFSQRQWSDNNHWVQRQFIDTVDGTTQAQMPIIEYLNGTHLNEHLMVKYRWKYRPTLADEFVSTDIEPSNDELSTRYPITNDWPTVDQFLLVAGDVTSIFPHGKQFSVESGQYPFNVVLLTVQESVYQGGSTRVYTTTPINITLPTQGSLVPLVVTSLGDPYLGVHNHWVLDRAERAIPSDIPNPYAPTQKQQPVVVGQDPNNTLHVKYNTATEYWELVVGTLPPSIFPGDVVYTADRQLTLTVSAITSTGIQLVNRADQNTWVGSSQQFATLLTTKYVLRTGLKFYSGTNLLRVYNNQIRQADSFVEAMTDANATTTVDFQQIGNTIIFINNFPAPGDIIQFESHVVDAGDVGREMVGVRRTTDDVFDLEYRSLVRYYREEQIKYDTNQYPMFDLFDHRGNHTGTTSSIWSFEEDNSYAPNKFVGDRRIKISKQRKVYHFINHLVDPITGANFCYKRNVGDSVALKTSWEFEQQYTPQLVDDHRRHDGDQLVDEQGNVTTVTVNSSNGVWELPSQMFYNPTHESRTKYSTTDLFAHYKSIIDRQSPNVPVANTVDFDYTVGGTIKEHNGGFDQWISSLLASEASIVDIIEFAKNQYNDSLRVIKQVSLETYGELASTTQLKRAEKQRTLIDRALATFVNGTWYSRVYGDSHSFDGTYGIANMITTASRMGLWPIYRPHVLRDSKTGLNYLSTHTGGRFDIKVQPSETNRLIQQIVASSNTFSSKAVPTYGELVPGQYWYNPNNKVLSQYIVDYQQVDLPTTAELGQLWINTTNNHLNKLETTGWVDLGLVTTTDHLLSVVDPDAIVASVALNLENRLFQVAAANAPTQKYDYSQLINTTSRLETYNRYLRDCFYSYCKAIGIDPFSNTSFKSSDPFTWNFRTVDVNHVNYPNAASVGLWAGHTSGIYGLIYGTDIPHLEPWKLQGFVTKPSWWNSKYSATNRRWLPEMWTNIKQGVVPAGVRYPSGAMSTGDSITDQQSIPSYESVPVNTTELTLGAFAPDDLLPVYSSDPALSTFVLIRDHAAIDMTDARGDWLFGDYAPTENTWRRSIAFIYDQLTVASRIDPIRFMFDSFGRQSVVVDRLNLDAVSGRVSGHREHIFHGQMLPNSNITSTSLGINQWYSNFFRSHDLDLELSNIHSRWTDWYITVGYPTSATVDRKSVDVFTKCEKLVDTDYQVIMKRGVGTREINVDNLIVNTVAFGAYNITYNARSPRGYGEDWTYRISTSSPVAKQIQYYAPKKYSAHYTGSGNTFEIASGHKLVTGDLVRLQTPNTLPVPLNRFDDYFFIAIDSTKFQLAYNKNNAINGLSIDIRSGTTDAFDIGAVRSTFVPLGGEHTSLVWTTFESDRSTVHYTNLPIDITGIQNVVDFVIGYSAHLTDLGITNNTEESVSIDPTTGRSWTWDLELERLIDQIYVGLGTSVNILKQDQPTLSTEFVELNPYRYTCLVSPSVGVIGNVFNRGPNYLRGDSLVYDQTGRLFTIDQLFVFRQDKQTTIALDTNKVPQRDPLNSIHIGGMRLVVDTYEHVIIFPPGTNDYGLVYDPHLGVETQSLFVAMKRTPHATGRPNVGGFFLADGQLVDNLEKVATDQSRFYDAHSSDEFAGYTDYARAVVGYDNPKYLDDLRLTEKSKFNFWRGMIQSKGNKRTLDVIKGSQQLQDISVDEFWAYRKASFGSRQTIIETLDVGVGVEDVRQDRILCHFPRTGDIKRTPYINAENTASGRYYDWINKRPTLDQIQNYYIEPKLTDVTNEMVTKVNQIQPDGSVADVVYLFTNQPYDTFVIYVDREMIALGSRRGSAFVPIGGQALVEVKLSQTIEPNTSSINVKLNGETVGIDDYVEYSDHVMVRVKNNGNMTYVAANIDVIQSTTRLIPGRDFTILGPTACRLNLDIKDLVVRAYGIRPDFTTMNTVDVIDRISGTIVQTIPVVMPHFGQYQYSTMLSKASFSSNDPAKYTQSRIESNVDVERRWGEQRTGEVWVDTTNLYYTDYFTSDHTIDQQLNNWANSLPNTGAIGYVWTSSPVPPSDWVEYTQSFDDPEGVKVVDGKPIVNLYYRTRESDEVGFGPWQLVNGEQIVRQPFGILASDLTSTIIDNPFTQGMEVSTTVEVFINDQFIRNVVINKVNNTIELPMLPNVGDVVVLRLIDDEWRLFQQLGDRYQPVPEPSGLIEYILDTPYTVTVEYLGVGEFVEPVNLYHFWVKDSSVPVNTSGVSVAGITESVNRAPDTFAIATDLVFDQRFNNTTNFKYTTVAVNGIDRLITSNDRFALRFKFNRSLATLASTIKQDTHSEWEMFRQHQPFLVPRLLWDKIVESIVGYKLKNLDPIPSVERLVYDRNHDTLTRYGIEYDQAIGDREQLIATIMAIILDPATDISPVSKDMFFDKYSFDTNEQTIETMNYIINNFPIPTINKIATEIVTDFISIKPDDKNLLKTSWISVSGNVTVESQ